MRRAIPSGSSEIWGESSTLCEFLTETKLSTGSPTATAAATAAAGVPTPTGPETPLPGRTSDCLSVSNDSGAILTAVGSA